MTIFQDLFLLLKRQNDTFKNAPPSVTFFGQFSMKFPFSMKLPFYRMILSKIKDTTT